MPDCNELTIHIIAAVNQDEVRRISERTKAALQAKKAQGYKLGQPGAANARKYRQEALGRAQGLADTVRELQATHPTVRALAKALNDRGVPTPKGGAWHVSSVHRLS